MSDEKKWMVHASVGTRDNQFNWWVAVCDTEEEADEICDKCQVAVDALIALAQDDKDFDLDDLSLWYAEEYKEILNRWGKEIEMVRLLDPFAMNDAEFNAPIHHSDNYLSGSRGCYGRSKASGYLEYFVDSVRVYRGDAP